MKTSNLLLIGGTVFLGWLYFTDVKRTKDKAKSDANAQVLAEALALANAQPQGNSNSFNAKVNNTTIAYDYIMNTLKHNNKKK